MEKIKKIVHLAQTKTAKNTYLVFVGNSIAAFLGMIGMILVSRSLGPAGFGAFSVSFALLSFMAKLGDLGLNFAVVKNIAQSRIKGQKKRIQKIFITTFWSKAVLCFIFGLIGLLLARYISVDLLKSPLSLISNRQVFLLFFVFVFYIFLQVYFQAKKQFLDSCLIYVVANVFKVGFLSLIYFFLPSFKEIILIYLFTPFLSALLFFPKTKLRISFDFHKKELARLLKFSSWMAVSVIFAAVAENLNVFMISSWLSNFETGIYSAAEKFVIPIYLFTGSMASVLVSRSSEFLKLEQIKVFIKKIMVLQLLLLGLFALAVPLANLLPFILGSEYQSSVGILQILIIAHYFTAAITPLNSVFYPLNKSIIFAIDSILKVPLLFGLNQLFINQWRAKGAALSLVFVNLTVFIVNYLFLFYQLRKHGQKNISLG